MINGLIMLNSCKNGYYQGFQAYVADCAWMMYLPDLISKAFTRDLKTINII